MNEWKLSAEICVIEHLENCLQQKITHTTWQCLLRYMKTKRTTHQHLRYLSLKRAMSTHIWTMDLAEGSCEVWGICCRFEHFTAQKSPLRASMSVTVAQMQRSGQGVHSTPWVCSVAPAGSSWVSAVLLDSSASTGAGRPRGGASSNKNVHRSAVPLHPQPRLVLVHTGTLHMYPRSQGILDVALVNVPLVSALSWLTLIFRLKSSRAAWIRIPLLCHFNPVKNCQFGVVTDEAKHFQVLSYDTKQKDSRYSQVSCSGPQKPMIDLWLGSSGVGLPTLACYFSCCSYLSLPIFSLLSQ